MQVSWDHVISLSVHVHTYLCVSFACQGSDLPQVVVTDIHSKQLQ